MCQLYLSTDVHLVPSASRLLCLLDKQMVCCISLLCKPFALYISCTVQLWHWLVWAELQGAQQPTSRVPERAAGRLQSIVDTYYPDRLLPLLYIICVSCSVVHNRMRARRHVPLTWQQQQAALQVLHDLFNSMLLLRCCSCCAVPFAARCVRGLAYHNVLQSALVYGHCLAVLISP